MHCPKECCPLTPPVRVRVAAAESMPLLLECARVRGPDYLTQMWHFMCDALIKSIGTEPDSDVLSEIMHAFAKVSAPPYLSIRSTSANAKRL